MPKAKNNSKSNSKSKDDSGEGNSKGAAVKGAQSLNLRHILCEKHSKKEEALAQIKAGIAFNTVASTFSEDKKDKGGALGWKGKNDVVPEFWKAAYDLPASPTTSPVYAEAKTGFGYHIIMVEGRK